MIFLFIEAGVVLGLLGFLVGGKISDAATRRSMSRSPFGRSISYQNYEQMREPWRHTGGYPSGHRRVTELPQVPGGPAPGARPTD